MGPTVLASAVSGILVYVWALACVVAAKQRRISSIFLKTLNYVQIKLQYCELIIINYNIVISSSSWMI